MVRGIPRIARSSGAGVLAASKYCWHSIVIISERFLGQAPELKCADRSRRLNFHSFGNSADDSTLTVTNPLASESQKGAFLGRPGGSIGNVD